MINLDNYRIISEDEPCSLRTGIQCQFTEVFCFLFTNMVASGVKTNLGPKIGMLHTAATQYCRSLQHLESVAKSRRTAPTASNE